MVKASKRRAENGKMRRIKRRRLGVCEVRLDCMMNGSVIIMVDVNCKCKMRQYGGGYIGECIVSLCLQRYLNNKINNASSSFIAFRLYIFYQQ